MDSRTKILPLEALPATLETGDWLVVTGLFDPLTAVEANRLAGFASDGRKLMAVVLSGGDTLLPAKARAELIASLRSVTAVVIPNSDEWRNLIPPNSHVQLIEDPEGDRARSADFVRFVLDRQNA